MIKKIIRIQYDPYVNHIRFHVSLDSGNTWQDLADTSELLKYQNQECVFSNCVEEIVSYINQYQNSNAEGLCIQFIGTDEDYAILESVVDNENTVSTKKGKIQVARIGTYKSADEAIDIIRNAYEKISIEFDDYLPGREKAETDKAAREIGTTISSFTDTVSRDIPICVIGTYSVGKSAFINAIIGAEILPSKVDPCTAKDVKVESSTEVGISFEYKGESITYNVVDGGLVVIDDGNIFAEEFVTVLSAHCNFTNKTSFEILHDILVAFNESKETFPEADEIGWNVSIRLPFIDSILNQNDCKIVIFDTPGSNNSDIDQKAHRESLEKMMREQTNALPIFVMDRNQVISNDNNEVKSLLDENRKGFSNPNCLIVFSKAENIPASAFNQAIPPAFLNWHGKATFLYVCAVGAIGAKKTEPRWLDPEYEDGYRDWKLKYNSDYRSLPNHNIIPCGRTMSPEIRATVSDELYATGIPSVEDEINYYVHRYANYKKCINGREMLIHALKLAKDLLERQRKELSETRKKKQAEKAAKRKELIDALEGVSINSVNILYVIDKYKSVLDKYCESVLPEIYRIWETAQRTKDPAGFIRKHMQEHCTEGLFREAYEGEEGIQREIVRILSKCADDYKTKLQAIVKGEENNLSQDAQDELRIVFDGIRIPEFDAVEIKGNQLLKIISQLQMPVFKEFFDEKYIESIAANICKQLKGQEGGLFKKDKLGLFAERCIQQPVQAYFSQLNKWKNSHLERIKETLDKENYILSQYDAYIISLEHQIESLQTRLGNLTEVEGILENVLEVQEEVR